MNTFKVFVITIYTRYTGFLFETGLPEIKYLLVDFSFVKNWFKMFYKSEFLIYLTYIYYSNFDCITIFVYSKFHKAV